MFCTGMGCGCVVQALDNGKFVLGAPPEPGQVRVGDKRN